MQIAKLGEKKDGDTPPKAEETKPEDLVPEPMKETVQEVIEEVDEIA
jgi:hypothetical protein